MYYPTSTLWFFFLIMGLGIPAYWFWSFKRGKIYFDPDLTKEEYEKLKRSRIIGVIVAGIVCLGLSAFFGLVVGDVGEVYVSITVP